VPERPTRSRLDHLTPGRPSVFPRGSWWLPAGSAVQHAYEIRLTGPDCRRPDDPGHAEAGYRRFLVRPCGSPSPWRPEPAPPKRITGRQANQPAPGGPT